MLKDKSFFCHVPEARPYEMMEPEGWNRRDGTGRDGTGRDGTGRDGTGRDGAGGMEPEGGNREGGTGGWRNLTG